MFCRLRSATVIGVGSSFIDVEVDLKKGFPQQTIVGLPDPAIREARERVSSAIRNTGFDFPIGRLTINLAPADLKKEGSIFDLAMAVGILAVSGQISTEGTAPIGALDSFILLGELSLDGRIRPIHGVLAILEMARKTAINKAIIPRDNVREAGLISGLAVYPVQRLREAIEVLTGNRAHAEAVYREKAAEQSDSDTVRFGIDFSEVKGQNYAVRAVEIAAAGGHNLLLIGSPGSGKTMIASRIPTILPDMTEEESIETTKIYSVAGLLPLDTGLIRKRPFRSPHHSASEVAIVGGGKNPIPGEVTLSHNGILFLDEFPEFKSSIIQSLRQPIESGTIAIARADSRLVFPARFMLVASMNPCPCGYLFDTDKNCRCSPGQINKYYMKVSGPVLDRIDLQVEVKPLKAYEIVQSPASPASAAIRDRVIRARVIQIGRLGQYGITLNSQMNSELQKRYCRLTSEMEELLYAAIKKYRLSARSYNKVLRVARTIADLDSREQIRKEDLLEALSFREVENILYNRQYDYSNGQIMHAKKQLY
jgi:magnesium chelatase family protein